MIIQYKREVNLVSCAAFPSNMFSFLLQDTALQKLFAWCTLVIEIRNMKSCRWESFADYAIIPEMERSFTSRVFINNFSLFYKHMHITKNPFPNERNKHDFFLVRTHLSQFFRAFPLLSEFSSPLPSHFTSAKKTWQGWVIHLSKLLEPLHHKFLSSLESINVE